MALTFLLGILHEKSTPNCVPRVTDVIVSCVINRFDPPGFIIAKSAKSAKLANGPEELCMRAPSLRISVVVAAFCVIIASVLLAGCGTASASTSASASATATCPPQASFKTVTGKISSTGSGTISVTDSQGKVAQVQISSTTRLTEIAHPAATSLAAGTSVLVLTDTNATVAQRINVLGAGANGSGSGGFGFGSGSGRPTGTPSASARGMRAASSARASASGRARPVSAMVTAAARFRAFRGRLIRSLALTSPFTTPRGRNIPSPSPRQP